MSLNCYFSRVLGKVKKTKLSRMFHEIYINMFFIFPVFKKKRNLFLKEVVSCDDRMKKS